MTEAVKVTPTTSEEFEAVRNAVFGYTGCDDDCAERTAGAVLSALEEIGAFDATPEPAAERAGEVVKLAEAWLRECSDWLLSTDLDMQCPMQTDPLDIADELAALSGQHEQAPVEQPAAEALHWCLGQATEIMAITAGCATTHGDPGGGLEQANRLASDIAANLEMQIDALLPGHSGEVG
jgi:hypothetical protein